jgi:hypothetical protein
MRPLIATLAFLVAASAAIAPAAPGERPRSAMSRIDRNWQAVVPAGEPVNCISRQRIRQTRVRNDSTIDFVLVGNQVFRNTLPYSCPTLGFEESFSYATSIDQLCSVDIITVFRRAGIGAGGGFGPSCGLGQFQPVAPAETP